MTIGGWLSVKPELQDYDSCFFNRKGMPQAAARSIASCTTARGWESWTSAPVNNSMKQHVMLRSWIFGGKVLQNCTSQIFRTTATRVNPANWASGCTPSTQGLGQPICRLHLSCLQDTHHATASYKVQAGSTELAMDNIGISESKQH